MSQGQLAVQQEGKLRTYISRPEVQQGIEQALGRYMEPGTFLSQMLIFCSKPEIERCTVASQFKAIHTCATLGLLPTYQQVALIPRKVNKGTENECYEVTVMPQWQGLKALIERVPEVDHVVPCLVGVSDQFVTDGDGPDMYIPEGGHRYDPLARSITKFEDIRGGYAKITFNDGRPPKYHFVTAEYIKKCRACSESYKYEKPDKPSPWTAWFEQQALKTVLRSVYARRVVNVDPMVAGRFESFLKHEDALLGNDPRIIEHEPAGPALSAPVSRSQIIRQQIQRRTEPTAQVEQRYGLEPGELRQEKQEQLAERLQDPDNVREAVTAAEGQSTGEQQTAEPQQQTAPSEFLDLLAETKTRRDVERLRDHYLNDEQIASGLTSDERDAVREACDGKLKEYPAPSVPAKPTERKTQKPLTP